MEGRVVGRDDVLDEARRALVAGTPVVLQGPAGIGKTAVWRALVAQVRRTGRTVLACAPTEGESTLPFAALADLLRPLADRVTTLPPPQRMAAQVVLLAEHSPEPIDERAVAAATRSLLEDAANRSGRDGILLAIDDAPWLDPHSERALRYALRRMAAKFTVLVACRTGPAASPATPTLVTPLGLDALPFTNPVVHIGLAPLEVGALRHLIKTAVGGALSRPLLTRIALDSGGNPLLAIEMARAVLRLPHPPRFGDELPVTSSVHQLVTDALATMPVRTRNAVRLAALLAVPSLRNLRAAGVPETAFEPAEEAGLLSVNATRVEFAHPSYASAVRASIPTGVRRRLRRRLAESVPDPDERARQLAQCTTTPDELIAAELAAAAARLRSRGAPAAAADLYDQAAKLTPAWASEEKNYRRLAAARCRFDSGDYGAAGAAADAAGAEMTGAAKAEALLLKAMVAWASDDLKTAVINGERGLAAAPPNSRLAGRIHAHLSLFTYAPEQGRRHAQAAIALLSDDEHDRELLCSSLLQLFYHEVRAGHLPRMHLLERAQQLEAGKPSWLSGTIPAIWWRAVDDHAKARARLHDMLNQAIAAGDEPMQHEVLTHLGETELLANNFSAAAEHIAAARSLGEQLGTGLIGEMWLTGLLNTYRGRLAEAERIAEAGLRLADERDDSWCRRIHLHLRGFMLLSAGRMSEAAQTYRELVAVLSETGVVESFAQRFEPDWIEAALAAGDLDAAQAALDRLTERHARLPRPWTALGLARSRVLLASAAGDDPTVELAELAAARDKIPPDVLPLDRARCLLVAGVAHRRARRKRQAREALQAAHDEFTAVGAVAFAERARVELNRIGVRTPAHPTRTPVLTPTEERVARMAAEGHTNKAIADALFISPKTVEANLTRVYRKLGIANRACLGAALTTALNTALGGRAPH